MLMRTWYIHDNGIPDDHAASICGFDSRGAFTVLRARGAFGRANADAVSRVSLREVAAGKALVDAERAGVVREQALPLITQIADVAYVRLAMLEFSRRSWEPRYVTSSSFIELAQKMHSEEGLAELQDRLGVRTRAYAQFAIFGAHGTLAFSDSHPSPGSNGQLSRCVDVWQIAQHIKNYVGGVLFHGTRECMLAA